MSGLIKSLGYVKVQTTDIERWRQFAFDVLGFAEGTGPDESALYLRMDERAARIIVVPGDTDQIVTVGWEVRDHAALERVKAALDAAGVPFKQLSQDEADARRVEEVIAFDDPAGTSLEVFHGAVLDHSPVVTPFGARFVTGDQGLGHVVLPATGRPRALRVLHRSTGFRLARRVPGAGTAGVRTGAGAVPRHQRTSPQPGDLPGDAPARSRPDPPDGGGRQPRRRRAGAGPGQQGRLPAVVDAGPAHQRQDGVVLRARARRLGHRVRHRRHARRRKPTTPQRKSPPTATGATSGSSDLPAAMRP